MRRLALAAFLVLARAVPVRAYEPLGYPGSTWGYVGRDLNGIDGNGTQGHVTQGVDWMRLPLGLTLETFAGYSWRFRSRNATYFNAHGPFAGAMVYRGGFSAGADYVWQDYTSLDDSTRQPSLFASWYWDRDIGRRGLAAPLSTWGRVFYDLNGVEGYGSMGWVQQGIVLAALPGGVMLETNAAMRWRLRSKNKDYYDAFGPALGIGLIRKPFNLAIEYAWRRYPALNEWSRGPQVALSWYFGWDLKSASSTLPRRSASGGAQKQEKDG